MSGISLADGPLSVDLLFIIHFVFEILTNKYNSSSKLFALANSKVILLFESMLSIGNVIV